MNLDEAMLLAQSAMERGEKSDGCTFAPEICTKCCKMHDMVRRFNWTTVDEADQLLRECFAKHGHPIIGWIYWCGIRLAEKFGLRFRRGR